MAIDNGIADATRSHLRAVGPSRRRSTRWALTMVAVIGGALPEARAAEAHSPLPDLIAAAYPSTRSEPGSRPPGTPAAREALWSYVASHQAEALPALDIAISAPTADDALRLDGIEMVVRLQPSDAAKVREVATCASVDLHQVDLHEWVSALARLALEGIDTRPAAERWLRDARLHYTLPGGASFDVDELTGTLFLYGPMDESIATPALQRAAVDPRVRGRDLAFYVLGNQATVEAVLALKTLDPATLGEEAKEARAALFATPPIIAPLRRADITESVVVDACRRGIERSDWDAFGDLEKRDPEGTATVAVIGADRIPLIRRTRRILIAQGTEASIRQYDRLTKVLDTLIWRNEWSH